MVLSQVNEVQMQKGTHQRSNEKAELTTQISGVWYEIIIWLSIPRLSDYVDPGATHHDREYGRGNLCIPFCLWLFLCVGAGFFIYLFYFCVCGRGGEGYVEEGDGQFGIFWV